MLCCSESCYSEDFHRLSDVFSSFPPLLGHVNVNVNHQDRSKSIKTAAFPVSAVTFKTLFSPVMVTGRPCRGLSEDPNGS